MSMQGGEEMEFGKQIKKLRQEAQLSQEELAERIYVSRQQYQIGKMIKAIQM